MNKDFYEKDLKFDDYEKNGEKIEEKNIKGKKISSIGNYYGYIVIA